MQAKGRTGALRGLQELSQLRAPEQSCAVTGTRPTMQPPSKLPSKEAKSRQEGSQSLLRMWLIESTLESEVTRTHGSYFTRAEHNI